LFMVRWVSIINRDYGLMVSYNGGGVQLVY